MLTFLSCSQDLEYDHDTLPNSHHLASCSCPGWVLLIPSFPNSTSPPHTMRVKGCGAVLLGSQFWPDLEWSALAYTVTSWFLLPKGHTHSR